MLWRIAVLLAGCSLWAACVACDESVASSLPDDLSKLVTAARGGVSSGDMTMDQIQQRDQLRDGTGASCPKASTANRGAGDQVRDQLQLRDGTGVNCTQ